MTNNYSSYSQGVHGSGGRTYTPSQAQHVLSVLINECRGPHERMTVEELSDRVKMQGRALRDAIRDLEVAGLVLTDFTDGYYVCRTAEEAESATRRLESQVLNMQKRIDARRKMADGLIRTQPQLL